MGPGEPTQQMQVGFSQRQAPALRLGFQGPLKYSTRLGESDTGCLCLASPDDGVLTGMDLNVQCDFTSADNSTAAQDQSTIETCPVL